MLERVIRALEASRTIDRIAVSIDAPELLSDFEALAARVKDGSLEVLESESSPSASVLAALPAEGGLLVTTADHALLDAELVDHFVSAAESGEPDVAIGLVSETVLRARFPEAQRTYLAFRGERYSGANLFAFRTPEARRAAEFWLRAEHFRKRPWRLVSTFGPLSLALFLTRRMTLARALERASHVIGARVRAVELERAEAAIDVDKLADLQLVEEILAQDAQAS